MALTIEDISRLLYDSGLGSNTATLDATKLRSATDKAQELLTQQLVDSMNRDKWPDTNPRTHLEGLVSDTKVQLVEALIDMNVDPDEAERVVNEFFDAHVLAGTGEDEIVDNAADRLSDDLSYSRDTAAYFGHENDDF